MSTDRDKANQALGELIALTELQLMRSAILATTLRKARAANHKQEVTQHAFGGNELATQIHLNLLDRFEGLMHAGNTLDQTMEVLRKEKWPTKLMNINF